MVNKFSYSQALLALALAFLAFSIVNFTMHVPNILAAINKTTTVVDSINPKVDDIIDEVAKVREEVGKVRVVVAEQTPKILSQINATLPVVKQVVLESEYYSRQLPTLLAEIVKIEQQIAILQASMPAILKRVDAVVKSTNNTTAEVSLWRPHSTEYLKEIALSRDYIPQYLSRIENTVTDAKTVGSETSSGLVSGFFKGVFSLPSEMVSGLKGVVKADSKSAKYLTVDDITLMQEKIIALLSNNSQTTAVWQNIKTGNKGMIVKGKSITRKGEKCIKLKLNNHFAKDKETLDRLMCVDDDGLWRVI